MLYAAQQQLKFVSTSLSKACGIAAASHGVVCDQQFLRPVVVGSVSFMHWLQAAFPIQVFLSSSVAHVGEGGVLELFYILQAVTSSKLRGWFQQCLWHVWYMRLD